MKKKDKYRLIDYALKDYGKKFNHNYKRKYISCREVEKLLSENKHSVGAEWFYCCYGLYENCWQDPFEEGVWDMTQEYVDDWILNTFKSLRKQCKRDNRIGVYEDKDDNSIHVVIVARDLQEYKCDYLFIFTDREYRNMSDNTDDNNDIEYNPANEI